MSYEKRVKDLMGRLTAMSPEPPPYPEEITMAEPTTARPRRPILMFAGAAVVVMALAIPLLLLDGDEKPDAAATTLPAPVSTSSTIGETSTTDVPDTTTTTPVVSVTWEGTIYLIQTPENSFSGDPALVPVRVRVVDSSGAIFADAQFTRVLASLDELGGSLPATFDTAIPDDVEVLDLSVAEVNGEAVLVADMNEAFLDGAGGALGDFTMLNQLIYTLTQSDPEQRVLFTVGNQPVVVFGSEGLVLTDPVGRDDFIHELNIIILTQPVLLTDESVDDDPQGGYAVVGRSNVFEAAMTVQVVNASTGEVTYEQPVMATSGSGTWGDFAVDIDAELIEPGVSSIRVFWYGAEDGTPSNVVTIPVPEGEVWELVPPTD
jgi:spore germination protein GerM